MTNLNDITKHLFYSAWVLTIVQIIRVTAVTLIATDFPQMTLIADIAFDCSLTLFGIGLLRLRRTLNLVKNWMITPILFFISAVLDILNIILTSTSVGDKWSSEPLVFLNLAVLLSTFLALIVGFVFLKFNIDYLKEREFIERKGQYYLPLGFSIHLIPSIIGWYGGYIGVTNVQIWQENLSLFVYLFATFLIILGFLGLSSTMKLLQVWSYEQVSKSNVNEEKEDV